jgi:hypothetical protein
MLYNFNNPHAVIFANPNQGIMIRSVIIFFTIVFFTLRLAAQNALPDFSIDNLGKGKVRVSWTNPFGQSCIQLSIQRSFDSAKNFRTLQSPQSPGLPQNGYIDNDYAAPYSYYRIFYVLEGGAYYFTKAKKIITGFTNNSATPGDSSQTMTVYFHDTVYEKLQYNDFKHFSDSVLRHTKDSLFTKSGNEVVLKPYVYTGAWIPSIYIYTDRTGNVNINIPDAKEADYTIEFYQNGNQKIFSVKHLDYTQLVLDKASFMHSGWFTFELFKNGKLKEKNKFFLQKEF